MIQLQQSRMNNGNRLSLISGFMTDRTRRLLRRALEQSQNPHDLIPTKSFDIWVVIAKYRFDVPTAAIPAAYPNYFRRKAQQYAEVTEVRVLGNDHETSRAAYSRISLSGVRSSITRHRIGASRIRSMEFSIASMNRSWSSGSRWSSKQRPTRTPPTLPGGSSISSLESIANLAKRFRARNRFHFAGAHFVSSPLRFRDPQLLDSAEFICIQTLHQKISKSCARFNR